MEAKLGKESAHIVAEALEESIRNNIEEGKSQLKALVSEELKKELATKYDLKILEKEFELKLQKEIDQLRTEIDLIRKDMRIMEIRIIAIVVILFVLSNPNMLDFLSRLFGIIK